ncbi:hypothetical protein Taro_029802 [Colocasia esculenta]|uniref:Protein kinase domain-containing protein n=1 Tax=Colocasia esculenta TaxID=4460 RepID=A0A843VKR6_COLES|nr:hypothetical protein [Colocasia esculenta]
MAGAAAAAALSLWALSFLSAARLVACSCPNISRFSCKEGKVDFDGQRQCGDGTGFRCSTDSKLEIQFGGVGQWFVRANSTAGQNELQIEDPTLSHLFGRDTSCDFLFWFPQPKAPFFAPPRNASPDSTQRISFSRCGVSDYNALIFGFIRAYMRGPCGAYDLHYEPRELQDLSSSLRNLCFEGGSPAAAPAVLVWRLSRNNTNSSDGAFNILSVGLSRRHSLIRGCFKSLFIGSSCDTAGPAHGNWKRNLIIGLSTAIGLLILLASLLLFYVRRRKRAESPSSSTKVDPEELSIVYPTHVFRYEELHVATDGFSPSNELGEGGHGSVYRGTLLDGRTVAIKRLYESSCRRAELFWNEVAILSGLRHPNLVALYGCTTRHSRELLLVYEFVPNGTIADHLHEHRAAEGALAWPLRLRIAVETAAALAHLHAVQPPIIHRDVKTNNILLDGDFHVKVGDFGLSRLFPAAASHVSTVPQGTPGYVDPVYHRCYQLTDKSDVYSFGVVLAELISSKPAVDICRELHEINLSDMAVSKIQGGALRELVDTKLGFDTDWKTRRSIELVADLVLRCLQRERDMRPTMEVVLELGREFLLAVARCGEGDDGGSCGGATQLGRPRWAPVHLAAE